MTDEKPGARGEGGATGRERPARFVPDLLEHGGAVRGEPRSLDARLYFQMHAFTACRDPEAAVRAVKASRLEAAVYANVNDPLGIGVLLIAEDPETFVEDGRRLLAAEPFTTLTPLPEFTMIGRTYTTGREPNLEDWLLRKPKRNALNPELVWAVWYPLRRLGAFNRLPREEQGRMMAEHAMIGRGYGEAGHALDIRLECHGLDRDDNEFVIGVVSARLHVLSKLIKDMRPTTQTSEYIEKMGPFFVGRVLYQAPLKAADARSG